MMFHVTARHRPEDCPHRSPEVEAAVSSHRSLADMAAETGVQVHIAVSAAPDHVFYAVLESDDLGAIRRLLDAGHVIPQEFDIVPVLPLAEAFQYRRQW